MSALTARETVIRYVEAVANGDLATIEASFTDDATWTYPGDLPLSGTWVGRTAILDDFLGGIGSGFFRTAPAIVLTNVIAEGDTVVAEWTAKATTATGLEYDNQCLGVFTVRDGQIATVKEYTDTAHAGRVLFGR
ncbi:nuclear transport factor 2 family protein [Hamadaea tsunoensis]|uniref:nuclear transport factor 2 family protein n=1 Tax=Hamadaea tsunoensis TaxID=53368 RepID=UPI00041791AE|nr:nuclear transport factor 2 family protein [Hamadaea tsunoensis]